MKELNRSLKKGLQLRDEELEAYKYYSRLTGEDNPKSIYDPENPKKRYKPRTKSVSEVKEDEEKDDGLGSEINITSDVSNVELQTTTGGTFGDTEGGMDSTLDPSDYTFESDSTAQKGEKRKKVEMVEN